MNKTPLIMMIFWVGSVLVNAKPSATQAPGYFERDEEGWHFYHEIRPETINEDKKEERQVETVNDTGHQTSPLQKLERIQQQLAEAKAKAVLYPTATNIQDYLYQNQWMLQQSSRFADQWRRVVWRTPALDYSLKRPHDQLAMQVFYDQRRETMAQSLKALAQQYGLWFFFRGSCPYCHRFAPIIGQLRDRYGFNVISVSLDGGALPEFPAPRLDTQVAHEIGVTAVPSVFLVNPTNRQIIPITQGAISYDALVERLFILTHTSPGDDF